MTLFSYTNVKKKTILQYVSISHTLNSRRNLSDHINKSPYLETCKLLRLFCLVFFLMELKEPTIKRVKPYRFGEMNYQDERPRNDYQNVILKLIIEIGIRLVSYRNNQVR